MRRSRACGLVAVHDFEGCFQVRKLDQTRFKITGNFARLRKHKPASSVLSRSKTFYGLMSTWISRP